MVPDTKIYQFHISLIGPKPKIWRRIQVPEDFTFSDMHVAIQNVFQWHDCHLHKFEIENPVSKRMDLIGRVDSLLEIPINEHETKLKDYFIHPGDKGTYLYDFGCDWLHGIVFEETFPAVAGVKYPRCTAGKNPGMLEDGNGVRREKFSVRRIQIQDPKDYWKNW